MQHQVLARKWRPTDFDGLKGQEHVIRVIKNAFLLSRLHHAYLFSGTRGVGKTSIARILAKAINCTAREGANPCHHCDNCLAFDAGNFIDLVEIDAASKTKVEDTRELLDNAQYLPQFGKFKVYIIDEVHMLSAHSFNALLKTLEEPPPHVKFILATTNPDKLPVTVISRCLHFHLRHLLVEEIAAQMHFILMKEGIPFDEEALSVLARFAKGSMRDALSLLDAAIMYGDSAVYLKDVHQMFGSVDSGVVFALAKLIFAKQLEEALSLLDDIERQGVSWQSLLAEFVSLFHQLSRAKISEALISGMDKDAIVTLSRQVSLTDLQLFYQIALKGQAELNLAESERVAFEMVLLRLVLFGLDSFDENDNATLDNTLAPTVAQSSVFVNHEKPPVDDAENSKHTQNVDVESVLTNDKPSFSQENERTLAENQKASAAYAFLPSVKDLAAESSIEPTKVEICSQADWLTVLKALKLKGLSQTIMSHSEYVSFEGGLLSLKLAKNQEAAFNDLVKTRVQDALSRYMSKKISLLAQFSHETLDTSLSSVKAKKKQDILAKTEEALLKDGGLKALTEAVNGDVLLETIQPSKSEL